MRRRERPSDSWPSWRYGPFGESGIFHSEVEVPSGWTKKPGEIYIPPTTNLLDRDSLIRQLQAADIEIDHTWGSAHIKRILDGDISPPR